MHSFKDQNLKKTALEIVWFKRDLRTSDHRPLYEASLSGLPIVPLFVIELDYWARPYASERQWYFVRDCLIELNKDLTNLGQSLIIKKDEVINIFAFFKKKFDIKHIRAHEETGDNWTYTRDIRVRHWCSTNHVKLIEYPNNGVVRGLKSREDWALIRNNRVHSKIVPKPDSLLPVNSNFKADFALKNYPMTFSSSQNNFQAGGRTKALSLIKSFKNNRGKDYLFNISSPLKSDLSCSRLSAHLAWGTVSIKEILSMMQNSTQNILNSEMSLNKKSLTAFKSRLAWRCHFIQKLEDKPNIETKCMHQMFEGIREYNFNPLFFKAWSEGKTGYPFIDACMHFLIKNGWITFRSRALLVSFASYNLWLDWRKTGQYLAQLFTDFEPGIHFSQMQMQSGVTGINAIRIYNPIKQSFDQDRNGIFIKKWVPRLKNVPKEFIHEPWLMDHQLQTQINCIIGKDYPHPIVEYKSSHKNAKAILKRVRMKSSYNNIAKDVFNKLGSRKKFRKVKPKVGSAQLSLDI